MSFEPTEATAFSQRILVIGVGGAGGNAVDNMIQADIQGVEFIAANTDRQALQKNRAAAKIQLGVNLTGGRGAGMNPEIGQRAAEESLSELETVIRGADMVFVAAGMGGGTGTGAAPIVAKAARASGALTVAVVTKPFRFEGTRRAEFAEIGVRDIRDHVDALIVIPNQNLLRMAQTQLTMGKAFQLADDVLQQGVRGITDLVTLPGLINLDFADVRTVMKDMGISLMGNGEASDENRALEAAKKAISNPLLDELDLRGARGLLINISGGDDLTLAEVDEAANYIRDMVDPHATIIFGAALSPDLAGRVRVSVVAAGLQPGAKGNPEPVAVPMTAPSAQATPIEQAMAPGLDASRPIFGLNSVQSAPMARAPDMSDNRAEGLRRPVIVTGSTSGPASGMAGGARPVEEPLEYGLSEEPDEGDFGADEDGPDIVAGSGSFEPNILPGAAFSGFGARPAEEHQTEPQPDAEMDGLASRSNIAQTEAADMQDEDRDGESHSMEAPKQEEAVQPSQARFTDDLEIPAFLRRNFRN